MTWSCQAIDHGITFFPNGTIGPCCQVASDYGKPLSEIANPDRFADLKTEEPPAACVNCSSKEKDGRSSYRNVFNSRRGEVTAGADVVFLDVRNTNLCNLKCRYCGPYYSNQWAKELGHDVSLTHTDISPYYDQVLTDNLRLIYFAGGEPLISQDHWDILDRLISNNHSQQIELMYSTNLTVLKFKDTGIDDFVGMWKKFRSVNLMISIDAIGNLFDAIRSNASWTEVEQNLDTLLNQPPNNIRLTVTCVLSLLNIWELESFVDYFNRRHIQIQLILLQRPDHLALDTVPDSLKSQAIEIIQRVRQQLPKLAATLDKAESLLINNTNQAQYEKFINSNSELDQLRGEQYMTFLPPTQGSK